MITNGHHLAHDAMKGARIGVPSDPADPLNDCYYGKLPPKLAKVMADAIRVLADLGTVLVRANMPTPAGLGGRARPWPCSTAIR
jgi:amidase